MRGQVHCSICLIDIGEKNNSIKGGTTSISYSAEFQFINRSRQNNICEVPAFCRDWFMNWNSAQSEIEILPPFIEFFSPKSIKQKHTTVDLTSNYCLISIPTE